MKNKNKIGQGNVSGEWTLLCIISKYLIQLSQHKNIQNEAFISAVLNNLNTLNNFSILFETILVYSY